VIVTGLTTDNCVLFTASDAYLRDDGIVVPADCVAAVDPEESRAALRHMARVLKADTRLSTEIDLAALAARPRAA
jgi:nicotinamidase-related amidase